MDQVNNTKKYPQTTSDVAKMLGIEHPSKDLPMGTTGQKHAVSDLPVANLPIEGANSHSEPNHLVAKSEHAQNSHSQGETLAHDNGHKNGAKANGLVKISKVALPYVAVFAVGLFLYYFFFSTTDFSSLFNSQTSNTPKQTALEQFQSQHLTEYQTWVNQFYYDVTDPKIIDPNTDNSGNGLSNFEKYLLNLNPKSFDTLGLGLADSEALAIGIDPSTSAALGEDKKNVIASYIDMEVVMNRLALNHLQHPGSVAGANTGLDIRDFSQPSPISFTPSTTNLNTMYADLDINTDVPGRLEIPALNVNVPIIWSKSEKDFNKDLQSGVIHYPGTAVPGQIGTTYISGHSSNYVWAKGDYNHVFSKLGDLPDGASFKITVVQKNGQDAIFHYVVDHKKEYSPTDPDQFKNTGESLVALSTCWPVGSTAKRLVVFGELVQVQK